MAHRRMWVWLAVSIVAGAGCGDGGGGHGGDHDTGSAPAVQLVAAFGGLSFDKPMKLVQHPTDDNRWYVVEQDGLVRTFLATNPSNITTAADVAAADPLFISPAEGGGSEQGLLGMAFDPGFATTGEVYFAYTRAGTSILARWVSRTSGATFTPLAPTVVLAIDHPLANSNGGDIMFGPDRFLYYSMGDGGGRDDPNDDAQATNVLLGKILRIDVNTDQGSDTYAVPADNPFVGGVHCNDLSAPSAASCPEIWALGFRNPRRMNFDPATGVLHAGDVGQDKEEEIDVVVRGANYGWDCVEGTQVHSTTTPCNFASFTPPEVVHGHSEAASITGGAVYRGPSVPGLNSFYVYGDLVTGNFFAFDVRVLDAPAQRLAPVVKVSAFGLGRNGEVYPLRYQGTPSILRFAPSSG